MAGQDFDTLVASGLLRDVEEIVIAAYLQAAPGATPADAYRWLRYEDPDPVARLADGVRRLENSGASFDGKAVDKAWEEASKMGYSN
jgi:hypothetical protein